jgi:dTDP-4-dehydrorhamnose reductase
MTIWITGAQGQVGRALCRHLQSQGVAHTPFARASLDITDEAAVSAAITGPGLIVNAAAYTDVDRAETETRQAFAVNRDGAGHLAARAAALDSPILHVSTDFVFDGDKPGAYLEDDPVSPLSVYGTSKAAGERAVAENAYQHIILRTSWVFSRQLGNFAATIRKAAVERDVLKVVVDQVGSPTPAREVAKALAAIVSQVSESAFDNWGIYHFAGRPAVSRFEFARTLVEGTDCRIEPVSSADVQRPAVRPAQSVLDCSKLRRIFAIAQPDWRVCLRDPVGSGNNPGKV